MLLEMVLVLATAAPPAAKAPPARRGGENESCTVSADCDAAFTCRQNQCVYKGTGESCLRAADCEAPLQCQANQCVSPTARASTAAPSAPPAVATPPPAAGPQAPTYVAPGPDQGAYPPPRSSAAPYEGPRERKRHRGGYVRYNEGDPIPPGMHVESVAMSGLWKAGLGLFLGVYITEITVTTAACVTIGCSGLAWGMAFLPVVGPFVQIGTTNLVGFQVLSALGGILETGGMAMFIAGLAASKQVLVPDNPYVKMIMPVASPQFSGLVAAGQF